MNTNNQYTTIHCIRPEAIDIGTKLCVETQQKNRLIKWWYKWILRKDAPTTKEYLVVVGKKGRKLKCKRKQQ